MDDEFIEVSNPGALAGGFDFSDDEGEGVYDTLDMIIYDLDEPENVKFTDKLDFKTDEKTGKRMLSEFEILDEIGDGSFSTVKKIKSTINGAEYSLKIYNKLYLQGQRVVDHDTGAWSNLLKRAARELGIWIHLDHPNVAKLYEVYEEFGKQYLYLRAEIGHLGQVSEFNPNIRVIELNKIVLDRYKQKKSISSTAAVIKEIFSQMLCGVQYFFKAGYAHRDIKLENLVINNDLKVMWIDFNSAKPYIAGSKSDTYEGTLHYAAPECIYNLMEGYDPIKAEVWSLGISLYGLSFGKLPFDLPKSDDNEYAYEMDLNMKIRDEPLKIDASCPPDLKELLEGMLQKDASLRWSLEQIAACQYMQAK